MSLGSLRGANALRTAALVVSPFLGSAASAQNVYHEQDGLLVIELESGSASGSWSQESSISGHTGSSYLRWDGPNLFSQPGSDIFGFDFEIENPGVFNFRIRNRHDHQDSTEANDVWVRVDGGNWVKVFSSVAFQWTWSTYHDFSEHNKPPAQYELEAGQHRIEFSGRSHDFILDRFHLYHPGHPGGNDGSQPESAFGPPDGDGEELHPIALMDIVPGSIPADDNGSTVILLDARDSYDPNPGQRLSYRWAVRGASFVQGTSPTDKIAKIRIPGGRAWPVRLTVTDDSDETLSARIHGVVNVDEQEGTVSGEPVAWHRLSVSFAGPTFSETDDSPNPFLDRRLNVTFTGPQSQQYQVPGFFAGDGKGGASGNVWRANFAPDAGGLWRYSASFRKGNDIAVKLGADAGTPTSFDGANGFIIVLPRDNQAPGFLSKGRLEYVGEHYLKHRDGPFFIKGGTDSPENLMGYKGFDGIHDAGGAGIVHEYPSHRADWKPGDPLFESDTTGVDSKGLIGALNYLSGRGVNAVYFLPMNLGGDAQDTHPFVGHQKNSFNKTHYDLGRMHQWSQVFDHATRRGVFLQFVLAETETANEWWLDDATLGTERKLFYRELSARFGHTLGLKWNLSEENDYPVAKLIEFASYIDAVDAYDHPITVHTHPNNFQDYWDLLGNQLFSSTSIQYDPNLVGEQVEEWRTQSAQAGHKWVLDMDENNPWHTGLTDSNHGELRKKVLYDIYFSGGQVEWYMGYHDLPLGGDLKVENFRTREVMWNQMRYAREFMQKHLPFWEMSPADELLSGESGLYGGGEVFAKQGQVYAVYLTKATHDPVLDLSGAPGTFVMRWFNPRSGQMEGSSRMVAGGQPAPLGLPPADSQEDWVALLKRR